ncbi:hypothetical protein MXB_2144 [Myxobolus squamalis]|nr:hypothetical protein MXB_2144 [Myxobolus squamalis]
MQSIQQMANYTAQNNFHSKQGIHWMSWSMIVRYENKNKPKSPQKKTKKKVKIQASYILEIK